MTDRYEAGLARLLEEAPRLKTIKRANAMQKFVTGLHHLTRKEWKEIMGRLLGLRIMGTIDEGGEILLSHMRRWRYEK